MTESRGRGMPQAFKCKTAAECLRVDRETWDKHVEEFQAWAREKMRLALKAGKEESAEHWRLLGHIVELDPRDWDGYGLLDRWDGEYEGDSRDCSCGCIHYRPLADKLAADWGVCTNPASHRSGKLTFEHQGCLAFEPEEDWP